MNLKLHLERLCDNRSWVRLHFSDGTTLTGRVLRLGHDYLEIESYGDFDKPTGSGRDYSKHLVPLALVKLITIESSSFADAERQRLSYVAQQTEAAAESTYPEIEK